MSTGTHADDTRELPDNVQYAPDAQSLHDLPHRRDAHALGVFLQCAAQKFCAAVEFVKAQETCLKSLLRVANPLAAESFFFFTGEP